MLHITPGIYNNHGHVQIRIWPVPKVQRPKPYTESGFGCWCAPHIKAAEKRLRALREEVESGKFAKAGEERILTIPEACDMFFKVGFVENADRTVGARKNIVSFLNRYRATWPTMLFHALTAKEVKAYMNERLAAGMAPTSVKRELAMLSSMYNSLTNWSRLREIDPIKLPEFNPVDPVERPNTSRSARTRVATWDELRRVKQWCATNDPDLWILIDRAITSLLRKQDLLKMQGSQTLSGYAGKTGKAFTLPGSFAVRGKTKNFRKRWHTLRTACNMQNFHWHDWKHTGATLMRTLGTSIELISEMMQHSDIKTTRIYTNAQAERFAPEVDKLKQHLEAL